MSTKEFARTIRGQSNYDLFLNVDVIVFCEGERGDDYDKPVAADEAYFLLDHIFWRSILDRRWGSPSAKFFHVGSKKEVIKRVNAIRADEELRGSTSHVLGCVDRDYDSFIGLETKYLYPDSFVLTDGYSAESDYLRATSMRQIIDSYMPRMSQGDRRRVVNALNAVDALSRKIIKIDCLFRAANIEFIPTDGVPAFVEQIATAVDFNLNKMIARFIDFRRKRFLKLGIQNYAEFRHTYHLQGFVATNIKSNGIYDLPGKTAIKTIANILNKFGKAIPKWAGINSEHLMDFLIARFQGEAGENLCTTFCSNRLFSWANVPIDGS